MNGECLSTTKGRTLALLRRVVCEAYAIRPYTGTRKRGAFYAYHNRETIKRTTFSTSHPITCPDRDHFFAVRVGAYCIRPTKCHPMDGECLYTTKGRTLALLRRVVCGAYAIRPYTGTRKRGAFFIFHNHETIKRTTFHVFHRTEYPEHAAFFTCYNRETIKRAAFYVFHRMTCSVCVVLGYIAIVERLRSAAFHVFYGMA